MASWPRTTGLIDRRTSGIRFAHLSAPPIADAYRNADHGPRIQPRAPWARFAFLAGSGRQIMALQLQHAAALAAGMRYGIFPELEAMLRAIKKRPVGRL